MTGRDFSGPHAVSLAGTLRQALDFAADARRWLEAEPGALSSASRDRVLELLGQIETAARELVDRFGLTIEEPSLRGRLRGHSSILWANLVDSESRPMRRYGAPPGWYADEVDPALQDLQRLAQEILYLSRERGQSE